MVVGGAAGEAKWWCDQGAVMDAEQAEWINQRSKKYLRIRMYHKI